VIINLTSCSEPGYYADGRFGIRIENVVVVKDVKTLNNFGDKGFLGFENFTMVSSSRYYDV
jgi:Xaa-Pro aminopeptidase